MATIDSPNPPSRNGFPNSFIFEQNEHPENTGKKNIDSQILAVMRLPEGGKISQSGGK